MLDVAFWSYHFVEAPVDSVSLLPEEDGYEEEGE